MADNNAVPNQIQTVEQKSILNRIRLLQIYPDLKSIETAVLTIPTDRIMPLKQK
jgi:hypothetical protein